MSSTIVVPDNFLVQGDKTRSGISGLRVQINLSYPNDPDLTATLYYYERGPSELLGQSRCSAAWATARTRPISPTRSSTTTRVRRSRAAARRSSPRSTRSLPLSAFAGLNAKGTWTLVIQNASTAKGTGTLNGWSLNFQKLLPTTGLGEPGSDNVSGGFRIFTLGQTDPLSSQAWTAVGPARHRRVRSGRDRRASRSTPPTPPATRSTSPAPAAASGRRPTS